MCANRRIYAARGVVPSQYFIKKLPAHAMQALKFKLALVGCTCALQYRRNGVRVVRRKLAEKCLRSRQHLCRTGKVGHIGIRLPREHRITAQPLHLRTLDLGIPVGTLHEPRHHAATMLSR